MGKPKVGRQSTIIFTTSRLISGFFYVRFLRKEDAMSDIVKLVVTLQQPQTPNNLQQRVLLLSNGETNLALGANATLYTKDASAIAATGATLGRIDAYWANNPLNIPLDVLEVGADVVGAVIAAKGWTQDQPQKYYAICAPAALAVNSGYQQWVHLLTGTTEKQYHVIGFYAGSTDYLSYKDAKSAIYCINKAGQHLEGAILALIANRSPNPVNKMTPFSKNYVNGLLPNTVTTADVVTYANDFVNYIGTGAEGGLSTQYLVEGGKCGDGHGISYWYAVDWVQVQSKINIANEVINGNNNSQNPLAYNQDGIDRLYARIEQALNNGVAANIIKGNFTLTAIPYKTYVTNNPVDVAALTYNGFSCSVTPVGYFDSITFAIEINSFA